LRAACVSADRTLIVAELSNIRDSSFESEFGEVNELFKIALPDLWAETAG